MYHSCLIDTDEKDAAAGEKEIRGPAGRLHWFQCSKGVSTYVTCVSNYLTIIINLWRKLRVVSNYKSFLGLRARTPPIGLPGGQAPISARQCAQPDLVPLGSGHHINIWRRLLATAAATAQWSAGSSLLLEISQFSWCHVHRWVHFVRNYFSPKNWFVMRGNVS